jgi:hypothetical protein
LLYSSIVGYDSLAIISLGRGISIYGGLFLLQLRLIINYIKSLFNIGFSDYILIPWGGHGWLTFYTTIEVSGRRISDDLKKAKILWNKSWFNNLVRLLIEWIVLLVTSLYSYSRLIFNLNSNLYDKDNLNCKESEVDDANLSSMETERRLNLILDS